MHATPRYARHRAIISATTIEILRGYSIAYYRTDRIGHCIEDVLIGMSLMVGQAEGKALSASDVSEYLGFPRATVVRRLKAAVRQGKAQAHVRGRRVEYTITVADHPEVLAAVRQMIARVRRGIRELSSLDDTDGDN